MKLRKELTRSRIFGLSIANIISEILLLMLGAGISYGVFVLSRQQEDRPIQYSVQAEATQISWQLSSSLNKLSSSFQDMTQYMISEDGWSISFVNDNWYGSASIIYAPYVPQSQLTDFLKVARVTYPDYEIKNEPNGERNPTDYFFPTYIYINNETGLSLGVDLMTVPEFSKFVSGISSNCTFFGAPDLFGLLYGIYKRPTNNTKPQDSFRYSGLTNLKGILLGGIVLSDIRDIETTHAKIAIFSADGFLLYKDPGHEFQQVNTIEAAQLNPLQQTVSMTLYDNEFTIVAVPTDAYSKERSVFLPVVILALVILFTLFMAVFSVVQFRQRRKKTILLQRVFPEAVAGKLGKGHKLICDPIADACILFTDLAGFTSYCSSRSPQEIVNLLHNLFDKYDEIAMRYGVEKIKIIGDSYMAATGLYEKKKQEITRR
eukprot:TRINITY_DN3617_c0_g1_i3.p1 TRINITY_DN3617_c0_g1~~TRINITY_DN3617_c0_g1_i3.p1  ORF type:complete len:432 (+),score=67.50 TRINITY_DN3617_c0_g1_i3:100-1395(+)